MLIFFDSLMLSVFIVRLGMYSYQLHSYSLLLHLSHDKEYIQLSYIGSAFLPFLPYDICCIALETAIAFVLCHHTSFAIMTKIQTFVASEWSCI